MGRGGGCGELVTIGNGELVCWLRSFEVELECIIFSVGFCACISFDSQFASLVLRETDVLYKKAKKELQWKLFTSKVIQIEL